MTILAKLTKILTCIPRYWLLTTKFIACCGLLVLYYPFSSGAVDYNAYAKAKVQILNKITGKAVTYTVPLDTVFNFDNRLSFIVKACYKSTQKYDPENVMFIQVSKVIKAGNLQQDMENNKYILLHANDYVQYLGKHKEENIDSTYPQMLTNQDEASTALEQDKTKNSGIETVDKVKEHSELIFSGWMYANYPEVSNLTDRVYDINLVTCITFIGPLKKDTTDGEEDSKKDPNNIASNVDNIMKQITNPNADSSVKTNSDHK